MGFGTVNRGFADDSAICWGQWLGLHIDGVDGWRRPLGGGRQGHIEIHPTAEHGYPVRQRRDHDAQTRDAGLQRINAVTATCGSSSVRSATGGARWACLPNREAEPRTPIGPANLGQQSVHAGQNLHSKVGTIGSKELALSAAGVRSITLSYQQPGELWLDPDGMSPTMPASR